MEEPKRGNIITPLNQLLYQQRGVNVRYGWHPAQRQVAIDIFRTLWDGRKLSREMCACLWLCEMGLRHWEAAYALDQWRDWVLGHFDGAMAEIASEVGHRGRLPRWSDVARHGQFWKQWEPHDHLRAEMVIGLRYTASELKHMGYMRMALFCAGLWETNERAQVMGVKPESEERAFRRLKHALRAPYVVITGPGTYVVYHDHPKMSGGLSKYHESERRKSRKRRSPDKFKALPDCAYCGERLREVYYWWCFNCADGPVGLKPWQWPPKDKPELVELANAEQRRRRRGEGAVREVPAMGQAYTQITGEWDDRED